MFEGENQYEEAILNFEKAADFYSAENAASATSKCLIKVAFLSAQLETPDFEKAAETFEKVGRESLNSNLLKFNAKGHFFNALLCILAQGDSVAAEQKLGLYKELDYTFEGAYARCWRSPCPPASAQ
jgi:alpha-soluble NSF attachment protein